MGWTNEQQHRLLMEKQILSKYFPQFRWIDPTGKAKVEGVFHTNAGNSYKIRVYVPSDFPNSTPDMVVISPDPLLDHDRNDLSDEDTNPDMHIVGVKDGYIKICHYHPGSWQPSITLYKVLLKGRIWVEAFDAHLKTGKKLDKYLHHWVNN